MFGLCFIFLVFQVALSEVCFLLVAFHWKAGALSMSGCAQLSPLLPQARNSVQSAQEASLSHWLLTEKLDGSRKTHKVTFFPLGSGCPVGFPTALQCGGHTPTSRCTVSGGATSLGGQGLWQGAHPTLLWG